MLSLMLNLFSLAILGVIFRRLRRVEQRLANLTPTQAPETAEPVRETGKEADLEAEMSAAMQEGIQNILGYSVGGGKDGM